MGEYVPGAPVNDEVRKQSGNLPGTGGVFNLVNLHAYHYAGNNPVVYVDPDGRDDEDSLKNYNIGDTAFKYVHIEYAFYEGLGFGASFTVVGTLSIKENEDHSYSANINVLAASPCASNISNNIEFIGTVDIIMNGQTKLSVPLKMSEAPTTDYYWFDPVGSAKVSLPTKSLNLNFKFRLTVRYKIRFDEGLYFSGSLVRNLPVFKTKHR
jgi:hypothetical protein